MSEELYTSYFSQFNSELTSGELVVNVQIMFSLQFKTEGSVNPYKWLLAN